MMEAKLNTLYYYCNDVERMRYFYIELLGLEETFYRKDDHAGWLTFEISGVAVVFVEGSETIPVPEVFAKHLGYKGGVLEAHSWVIEYPPEAFEGIVIRMQAARIPPLNPAPIEPRPGHRQFVVRDPMGSTVELYSSTINQLN